MPTLAEVIAVLDDLYDPRWAEPWDAVGLVCGDPTAEVRRVLFAVDPVEAVVDEAIELGADLVVAHHPVFLRPVHGVAATSPKGRVVHRLVTAGVGLHVAHTNADVADPGVSDALARALGLDGDLAPLSAQPADPLDKVVTFVPHADADRVVDALAAAGAGAIGDYTRCAWTSAGTGTFRPGDTATPTIGRRGEVVQVAETRVEMVLPRRLREVVVAALRAAHPYEEPAYDVLELATWTGRRGVGRVARLPQEEPLGDVVERAHRGLPATVHGIRVAGDLDLPVRTIAVAGGAGDSLFDAARRAGVNVLVTADLRHHPASESQALGAPALVDVSHWSSEWPWLPDAAERLVEALAASGTTVDTDVSTLVTDPWTSHHGYPPPASTPQQQRSAP